MKPTRHIESSSRSNSPRFTKTTTSSCDSLGKSVMSRYTSLREIMSVNPPPPPPPPPPPTPPPASSVKSPAMHRSRSGSEIPIRNPLVKQAALAYLQPMGRRPPGTVVEEGLFGKLKEVCCVGQCGCLEWLHSVVSMDFFSTEEEDDRDQTMRRRTTSGG
ncbi:hypothetical protein AALP_AA4G209800 [Arabis alpina]|uniref:Uncharacterized protein n=1 Tax=Arabis alpina TaxID=50452 RepID=A0A087H4M6_ARAAL|nr:hypothetical protein AALP_AA4G209800 [Arabis alpina]